MVPSGAWRRSVVENVCAVSDEAGKGVELYDGRVLFGVVGPVDPSLCPGVSVSVEDVVVSRWKGDVHGCDSAESVRG